jgi:hypothetical protein
VFEFLAAPENHRLLAGRGIELLELGESDDGSIHGQIMIRGPLGMRRSARTRVLSSREPSFLSGTAPGGAGSTLRAAIRITGARLPG